MTRIRTTSLNDPATASNPPAFSTWPLAHPVENGQTRAQRSTTRRWMPRILAAVVICMALVPFVFFAQVYRQARSSEAHAAGAIVVLGAAQFDGTPSQVFQARLDTAAELYRQGYAPLIVVTGGRLQGDRFTEAEAGRTYLVDRGVPTEAILMENISHNTAASFTGVKKLLQPRGIDSLLIVSDGFHLYRSEMLANDAGFTAYGFAAEQSPIRPGSMTELRYMVRETLGVLAWKLHIKR